MQITCPSGASGTPNIKVVSNTICVQGTVNDGNGTTFVRARVVNGFVGLGSAPNPNPALSTDGKAIPSGQNWFAQNVGVASSSDAGVPLTVFAWLMSGSSVVDGPVEQQFYGGGACPTDCCLGSGSGSGSQGVLLAVDLESAAALLVTVASGRHAGSHTAVAVASGKWSLEVGGMTYAILYGKAGLIIEGPYFTAPCISLESGPFSATFPGDILEADEEIVVIVA